MKVFTTGQVAKICRCDATTVVKWFDTGRLRGYRVPGTQERRIPREYLFQFLWDHALLDDLGRPLYCDVLVVSSSPSMAGHLQQALPETCYFSRGRPDSTQKKAFVRFAQVRSNFEAGLHVVLAAPRAVVWKKPDLWKQRKRETVREAEASGAQPFDLGNLVSPPNCLIVDYQDGHREAAKLCERVRSHASFQNTVIIALCPPEGPEPELADLVFRSSPKKEADAPDAFDFDAVIQGIIKRCEVPQY